jgi:hypothetical protein
LAFISPSPCPLPLREREKVFSKRGCAPLKLPLVAIREYVLFFFYFTLALPSPIKEEGKGFF